MTIKKNLIALSILSISLPLCLSGCNKKVEPITDKTESTIIKDVLVFLYLCQWVV